MKIILALVLLSLSALSMRVSVKEVLSPDEYSENYLVLASNGEVLELDPSQTNNLEDINWALENKQSVEIEIKDSNKKSLNQRNKISQIKLISERDVVLDSVEDQIPTPLDGYKVAEALGVDVIKKMFLFLRPNLNSEAQCYNRAHIWVHDLSSKFLRNRTINLGKMWLFFTKRYIREFNYKWWFHVAPYTYLKGDSTEIILDRTYYHSPRRLQNWTNYFMKNNSTCTQVQYYSHYNNNQENAYCYVIKSSMYYYQPYQIENLEKGEAQKHEFLRSELELAYKDAMR